MLSAGFCGPSPTRADQRNEADYDALPRSHKLTQGQPLLPGPLKLAKLGCHLNFRLRGISGHGFCQTLARSALSARLACPSLVPLLCRGPAGGALALTPYSGIAKCAGQTIQPDGPAHARLALSR